MPIRGNKNCEVMTMKVKLSRHERTILYDVLAVRIHEFEKLIGEAYDDYEEEEVEGLIQTIGECASLMEKIYPGKGEHKHKHKHKNKHRRS